MKKILFIMLLTVVLFTTTACSMILQGQQYDDYGETYQEDYAYLDDYTTVNWYNAKYTYLQYSYYDFDRVFIVIYGNRIYIIPYAYFYHYIMPHFRGRIIWRSYDYLANWWGYNYYNGLWSHWHHRHYRSHWRPNYNYYYQHKNRNNNRPFIIRKNEIKRPAPVRPYVYRPENDRKRIFKTTPNNERRIFVPKHETQRKFNTQPPANRQHTSPPPVNRDNHRASARKKE